MNITYPLCSSTWGEEEVEAGCQVLRSGNCTMGEKVQEYETQFAKFFGSKYAIMVNSGSSANLLAVAALSVINDLVPGDEVLVPAIAWATTYFPLHQYGLNLRVVDVDMDTLNMSFGHMEKSITQKTRAIMMVNLLGNPNDSRFKNFCKMEGLNLIEDNCESMGAKRDGKFCGTFGRVGTFSTFFSHHICTMEGGVIVTDDEKLADIMKCLRAHGWTRELPNENHVENKTGDPWQEKFRFALPGYNFRPTEVNAAIGIQQLKKLPEILETRRVNAIILENEIEETNKDDIYLWNQTVVGNPSYYAFPLILGSILEGKRTELIQKLTEAGVETRPVMSGNIMKSSVVKKMNISHIGTLRNAEYVDQNGFMIGNSGKDLYNELEICFNIIRDFIKCMKK